MLAPALLLVLLSSTGPSPARQAEPPTPAQLIPVETDATRAMAKDAKAQCELAKKARAERKIDEARATLRALLERILATPGRETSEQLNRALYDLGLVSESLSDPETVIRALEPALVFELAARDRDHLELQAVRTNLGNALWQSGELVRSEELLREALESLTRSREPDDPYITDAKANYAVVLYKRGELERARELMAEVVERTRERFPEDHPEVQKALGNLANVTDTLGDIEGARELREGIHANLSARLPADSRELQVARSNLALSLRKCGDPAGARLLMQEVLEVQTRILPAGSRDLDRTRQGLALALRDLGDLPSARVLLEEVVTRLESQVPDDDEQLAHMRQGLAAVYSELGQFEKAYELDLKSFETRSATFGESHTFTLRAMQSLACDLSSLGRTDEALEMARKTVDGWSAAGFADSIPSFRAQSILAQVLFAVGKESEAIELQRSLLEAWSRRMGSEHREVLVARGQLAGLLEDSAPAECRAMLLALADSLVKRLVETSAALSPREGELSVLQLHPMLDPILALCREPGDAALCFGLVETARAAPVASARSLRALRRATVSDREVTALRDELRRKSAQVAALAQEGSRDEYRARTLERAALEARLAEALRKVGVAPASAVSAANVAASLAEGTVAVGYRRFDLPRESHARKQLGSRYVAFVVAKSGKTTRVDLGDADEVERAISAWREALGAAGAPPKDAAEVRAAGAKVRAAVLDPVLAVAGDAKHLRVALDDALHLVPLDALPSEGDGVVGDRIAIDVCVSFAAGAPAPSSGARDLVALGGIDFDAPPGAQSDADGGAAEASAARLVASLRGSTGRVGLRPSHFDGLASSAVEVQRVADIFRARELGEALVLTGRAASKEQLIERAPSARYLHIATHGFTAPDTAVMLGAPSSARGGFEEEVCGLSPRVLSGLALAGANLPGDPVVRSSGTLTAEELAYLELDRCELAVLSACETNLGVRRAGVGIASLQSALHAAGASATVTSLWKVPDEATRDLMLAFYAALWNEGLPQREALWKAKQTLRERRAPVRDWAGWILTRDAP